MATINLQDAIDKKGLETYKQETDKLLKNKVDVEDMTSVVETLLEITQTLNEMSEDIEEIKNLNGVKAIFDKYI